MLKLPDGWWRRKLIEAFEYFSGQAKNYQIKQYLLDHYKSDILSSVKETSIDGSINGQLQFHSKLNGGNNFSKRSKTYDLFYKDKVGHRILKNNYENELMKYDGIYQANDLDLSLITKEYIVNRVIRDTKIVKELKDLYNNSCQICRDKLQIGNDSYYSEGHHVKPLKYKGPDIKENIIILCPNHHAAFDYGTIAISPNDTSKIEYKYGVGQEIDIFFNNCHSISIEYLNYHYEKIFKIDR